MIDCLIDEIWLISITSNPSAAQNSNHCELLINGMI